MFDDAEVAPKILRVRNELSALVTWARVHAIRSVLRAREAKHQAAVSRWRAARARMPARAKPDAPARVLPFRRRRSMR